MRYKHSSSHIYSADRHSLIRMSKWIAHKWFREFDTALRINAYYVRIFHCGLSALNLVCIVVKNKTEREFTRNPLGRIIIFISIQCVCVCVYVCMCVCSIDGIGQLWLCPVELFNCTKVVVGYYRNEIMISIDFSSKPKRLSNAFMLRTDRSSAGSTTATEFSKSHKSVTQTQILWRNFGCKFITSVHPNDTWSFSGDVPLRWVGA